MGKKPFTSSKQKASTNSAFKSPDCSAASHPAYNFAVQPGSTSRAERCCSEPCRRRACHESCRFSAVVDTARWQDVQKVTNTNKPTRPYAQSNLMGFLSYLWKNKHAWAAKCLEILTPWVKAEPSGHCSTFSWSEWSEANIWIVIRFPAPQATCITTTALQNSTEIHQCAALRCFVALLARPGHWSLIYLNTFNFYFWGCLNIHIKTPLGRTGGNHLQLALFSWGATRVFIWLH